MWLCVCVCLCICVCCVCVCMCVYARLSIFVCVCVCTCVYPSVCIKTSRIFSQLCSKKDCCISIKRKNYSPPLNKKKEEILFFIFPFLYFSFFFSIQGLVAGGPSASKRKWTMLRDLLPMGRRGRRFIAKLNILYMSFKRRTLSLSVSLLCR